MLQHQNAIVHFLIGAIHIYYCNMTVVDVEFRRQDGMYIEFRGYDEIVRRLLQRFHPAINCLSDKEWQLRAYPERPSCHCRGAEKLEMDMRTAMCRGDELWVMRDK